MLIYLASPLQKRVLPTFHYALNVPGFLMLGSAETVGESADLFEIVDRGHKIYAKKATAPRQHVQFPAPDYRLPGLAGPRRAGTAGPSPPDFQREADRILLSRYAPPGVLVNENLDVVHFRGRTSAYLEPPPGEPTTNVLKMAREGLFLDLRNALAEARKRNQAVRREGVRVRSNGGVQEIDLEIVPVNPAGSGEGCCLVLFHERPERRDAAPPSPEPPVGREESGSASELLQLRQELAATREYLQSLVEQQDAANEELRSANEEILSSNEELQSTNEELETAKEELQSANEELTTVNEQLQHRNLELSQVNNDLTNLLSSTNIPVVMVGSDLRIRRFTPPAKKSMSLLPSDVGRPIGDIKPSVQIQDLEGLIGEVIESVQPRQQEVRDRDGRWYELRVYPYRTSDHKIDGAVILLVDVDQVKRSQEAIRESDRRKDEFLAILAHELRNPLAPISNAVEILDRAGDDKALIVMAGSMLKRQVRQLSRIVDDLIDVSRIVEKKIHLHKERILLSDVVKTAVETCRSVLAAYQHHLTINLSPDPLELEADPVRLAQVLINLLNNAAKFTEPGGQIWIFAARETPAESGKTSSGAEDEVVMRVKDNGIGISSELMPRVFDMFIQGDRAVERRRGGLGIGLTLVRSLVEMHGGTVEAQSSGRGQGSEFVVRLPLADRHAPAARAPLAKVPATEERQATRRVLVVDDNADQAQSLAMLLRMMGNDVHVATDGHGALAAASAWAPEIALVDIGLPNLSGYEVARQLRAQPRFQDLLLVAQTGWGQDTDRQRSEEAGFDYHFVKPISPEDLKTILAKRHREKRA